MVLVVAYILVGLFVIGVFDLLVSLGDLLMSGQFVDPFFVVGLIDTVLTLLIIVEIHRLLLAYIRQDPVIQIVINVGIIAIAREIISFRVADYCGTSDALFGAAALAVLLLVLVLAFFVLYNTKGSDDIALPNWGSHRFGTMSLTDPWVKAQRRRHGHSLTVARDPNRVIQTGNRVTRAETTGQTLQATLPPSSDQAG
jgi:Predicted membrane protein